MLYLLKFTTFLILHVPLAIHICGFHICRFNQSQIENIWKKLPCCWCALCSDTYNGCACTEFVQILFSCHPLKYINYLYCFYIALGLLSNVEMIDNIWEGVFGLYANTTPFLYKGLEHPWIWLSTGALELIPCGHKGMTGLNRLKWIFMIKELF